MHEFERLVTGNLAALVRSLWAELGAVTDIRRHKNCAVDPEPLIVFTSYLANDSPELCQPATNWCIQHAAYISAWRLDRLRARAKPDVRTAFDRFATVVRTAGVARWPGEPSRHPACHPTNVNNLPLRLDRPALVSLRLRELFGTGAPSEVLLALLSSPKSERSLAEISELTGYSERNINEVTGGKSLRTFFDRIDRNGHARYRLVHRVDLELLLRVLPERFPPWLKIFNVFTEIMEAARATSISDPEQLHRQALRVIRELTPDLRGLRQPLPRFGSDYGAFWSPFVDWSIRLTAECALGNSIVFGPALVAGPLAMCGSY